MLKNQLLSNDEYFTHINTIKEKNQLLQHKNIVILLE